MQRYIVDSQSSWDFFVVDRLGSHTPTMQLVLERFQRGVALGVFEDRETGPDPDSEAVLAVDGSGAVLGFATFYEIDEGRRLWLHLLWVDEVHRRRGIAGDLLEQLEAIAADRGLQAVLLGRAKSNPAMVALLAQQGWPVEQVVHCKKIEG